MRLRQWSEAVPGGTRCSRPAGQRYLRAKTINRDRFRLPPAPRWRSSPARSTGTSRPGCAPVQARQRPAPTTGDSKGQGGGWVRRHRAAEASRLCRTITIMARRLAAVTSHASPRRRRSAQPVSQDDEATVRTYLRALIGSPVRSSDRTEDSEPAFVQTIASWSEWAGVDRRTLAAVGVPRRLLNEAGVRRTPVGDLVRRRYTTDTFTVAELVRRSGASPSSVRKVLAEDERVGRLKRVATTGRTVLYGLC